MIKFLRYIFILICFAEFLIPLESSAQIDDIGLRLGATVQKQFTRKLQGSLTEELRLNHDITTIDALISDAGLEYAISKKFKAGIYYRFINSNQDNYYSKRHRIYLDVAYKDKFKFITYTIRERIQEQYSDYYSSETGKIPVWTIRSKLATKFDIKKKYTPYLSVEMYYLLDNAKETDHLVTRLRYETGIIYEINRTHSINPYLLLQNYRSPEFALFIYGISYTISL